MKVFIAAFLVVAASASPLWLQPTVYNQGYPMHSTYTTGYPVAGVQPLVHAPVTSYYQPLIKPVVPIVHKPVVSQYVKEDKINVEKIDGDKLKVYKTEEVKPIVYKSPFQTVIPTEYKVEVPAQYHAKNGKVEHALYKRDAEPYWPYAATTYAAGHQYMTPYMTPYAAQSVLPVATQYTQYGLPMVHQQVVPQAVEAPKITYKKPEIETEAKTIANDAINPFGYADKNKYVADSVGALHIAKRDAESQFIGYHAATPYMYQPTVYNTHLAKPLTYAQHYPAVYSVPQYKIQSYANDAVKPEQYASKGQYFASHPGATHVA